MQSNKLFNVGSLLKNKQYDHPYFLPTALRKPSFEWVYAGGMAGPGAVGHIDILCQCSWALQIQGTKRWWLRSPLLESLDGASDARVGGAGQSLEFLQKPGEMFFFCPGWWHSTYVEEPDDEANANAAGEAEAEAGSGWKKTKKKQVESLSLHAYVDLRPVGWGGDKAGTGALEQTDLLRTSIGGALAHSARGTEYAWTLTNSSYENKRDPTMLDQLVRLVCRQRACTAATDLQTDSLHSRVVRQSSLAFSSRCFASCIDTAHSDKLAGWRTCKRFIPSQAKLARAVLLHRCTHAARSGASHRLRLLRSFVHS